MRTAALFSATACLAATAWAIPPEDFGFPSAPNDTALTVTYGRNVVSEGVLFGINVPAQPPSLAVNTSMYRSLSNYSGSYLVLMVDPDASTPQNPSSRFILHWMQPNLTVSSNAQPNGVRALSNATAPSVPYMRPAPPPTSDAHRYILYAFQQRPNFTIPAQFSGLGAQNRSRFNLTDFISAASLGQPAAANFYYCINKTNVPADFVASAGGSYPGGNGAAVTRGPGPAPSATPSGAPSASGASASPSPSSSGNAAASIQSSSVLGNGLMAVLGIALYWAL